MFPRILDSKQEVGRQDDVWPSNRHEGFDQRLGGLRRPRSVTRGSGTLRGVRISGGDISNIYRWGEHKGEGVIPWRSDDR